MKATIFRANPKVAHQLYDDDEASVYSSNFSSHRWCRTHFKSVFVSCLDSMTRLGNLLDFGQLFKALGHN